jgi:hypothetical protein
MHTSVDQLRETLAKFHDWDYFAHHCRTCGMTKEDVWGLPLEEARECKPC